MQFIFVIKQNLNKDIKIYLVMVMLSWEQQFIEIMERESIKQEDRRMSMNDIKIFEFTVRLRWRWQDNCLVYCTEWRLEIGRRNNGKDWVAEDD